MKRSIQHDMFSDLQYRTKAKSAKKRQNRSVAPTSSAAPLAANIRMAAKVVAMDTGYVDTILSTISIDTDTDANNPSRITLVNPVPVGAAQTSRVGKKVLLKGFQIRGLVYQGTTATFNDVCLLLVYDKRPTGSKPATTDFLNTISATSMNKDDNASRFRILRRMDLTLVGAGSTTSAGAQSIDTYVDLKKAPTVYKSVGTGAVGDIAEGALWLVMVGSAAPGTTAAFFSGNCRVRYYDP